MKTRCPACGATTSLDALIGHEHASRAINSAMTISPKLGRALVQYLALFRSGTRELTFDRVSKLIDELQPDIERAEITRDRINYPAPTTAWIWAIEQTLQARDNSKLTLPLKTHGFLYAIITQYKPDQHNPVGAGSKPAQPAPPTIRLTPAQQKLEEQINATTNRLKTQE